MKYIKTISFILLFALAGCGTVDQTEQTVIPNEISAEENARADNTYNSSTQTSTEEDRVDSVQSEIDQFITDINASGVVELMFSEDFTPSDKESSHYRTEFRLNAYREALGKSYKYGDATVDIILSSDGTILRIYMDGASLEQCEDIVRYASSLLDQTVTDSDIQETIEYIDQNKTANGYYYAELGLLLLGSDSKGYEFMLKR